MINKNGNRELAYIVRINDIKEIENADRVELAIVQGWSVLVRKNQFKIDDLACFIEIDSKVPQIEPFMFLEKTGFKVKTQKYFKGKVISQGLLMSLEDFNWKFEAATNKIKVNDKTTLEEGSPVTEILGITYYSAEDNQRKNDPDKYKAMTQRKPEIFKKKWAKWLMRREWGRELMFALFGKKKDNPNKFPTKFVGLGKTDEERIENLPQYLGMDNQKWIVTEKIDGTSTTFIMERVRKNKFEFYVCSRNIRITSPDKETYHDTNVYWDMAKKYDIEKKLKDWLIQNPKYDWIAIQGETYGLVQGNPYKMTENEFAIFNCVDSVNGRVGFYEMIDRGKEWKIPCVPYIETIKTLPDTIEKMKAMAEGNSIINTNVLREGLVYRNPDNMTQSFKNVSNSYLLKHSG